MFYVQSQIKNMLETQAYQGRETYINVLCSVTNQKDVEDTSISR